MSWEKVKSFFERSSVLYSLVVLLQLLMCIIAFNKVVFHPDEFIFASAHDGLKNYYTYYAYVQQPDASNPLLFTQMNYPYGDYIFFTDNTPIAAITVKYLGKIFPWVAAHATAVFNYSLMLQIIICSVLIFHLLRGLIPTHGLLLVLISVSLAWFHPQAVRIIIGHFNLAAAGFLVAALVLMWKVYKHRADTKAIFKYNAYMVVLICWAAFSHLYFLLLLAFPYAVYLACLTLWISIKNRRVNLRVPVGGLMALAIGGSIVFGTVRLSDTYFSERREAAEGLFHPGWSMRVDAFMIPYEFMHFFHPPIEPCVRSIPYESHAFWGNATIYTLCFLLLFLVYKSIRIEGFFINRVRQLFLHPFLFSMVFVVAISYALALGFTLQSCFFHADGVNRLNPLLLLGDDTNLASQFRCLGRFNWIAFWIINIGAVVMLYRALAAYNKTLLTMALSLYTFIAVMDMVQFVKFYNLFYFDNVFNREHFEHKYADFPKVDFGKYQAIMPIPIFITGSESYDISIDDMSDWSGHSFELSSYSGLPLMSSKMSRTSVLQTASFIELFTTYKVPEKMLSKMNDKPVLVMCDNNMAANYSLTVRERTECVVREGAILAKEFKMDTLFVHDGIVYLEWDVKNHH